VEGSGDGGRYSEVGVFSNIKRIKRKKQEKQEKKGKRPAALRAGTSGTKKSLTATVRVRKGIGR